MSFECFDEKDHQRFLRELDSYLEQDGLVELELQDDLPLVDLDVAADRLISLGFKMSPKVIAIEEVVEKLSSFIEKIKPRK
jgi:hypothetical protein